MNFPFPNEEMGHHRAHGLIEGTFGKENGFLTLQTSFGPLKLYPAPHSKNVLFAAYTQNERCPNQKVQVYGYPRTNKEGRLYGLVLASFWPVGAPVQEQHSQSVAHKFMANQFFVTGRIRSYDAALSTVVVRVKAQPSGEYWHIVGKCFDQVEVGSKTLFMGWTTAGAEGGNFVLVPVKKLAAKWTPSNRKPRAAREHPQGSASSAPSGAPRKAPAAGGGRPRVQQHEPSSRSRSRSSASSAETPQRSRRPQQSHQPAPPANPYRSSQSPAFQRPPRR